MLASHRRVATYQPVTTLPQCIHLNKLKLYFHAGYDRHLHVGYLELTSLDVVFIYKHK